MPSEVERKIEYHFSQYPLHAYPKGQILIHAGDRPQHILYLVEGKVRQYDISYRGDEVVVNVFKPGAFFPMLWAVTDLPNRYFFDAETPIRLRAAPRDETIAFLKANPDVMFDLLTRVYVGVNGMLERMVRLMSGSANSRVLFELLVECRRFGEKGQDGSCFISINESDIAARAGLSRETVSREIKKLNRGNLIHVSHSGILVRSLKVLEEKATAGL